MSTPLNMHAARMALNRDPELRQWVEQWLKSKERTVTATMTDEEFEKHWFYVRPERMHEGALEALGAYQQAQEGWFAPPLSIRCRVVNPSRCIIEQSPSLECLNH